MIDYTFTVFIPEGLHTRPCAKLVEILKPFEPLSFSHNNITIEVLSILELLLLKISYGSSLTITASAPLPPSVLKNLQKVFEN